MNEFDAQAREWDADPMKVERAHRVADAILEQAGPLGGKRAMDYGCGTGLLGFALHPHLAHLTLADTSTGMLAVLGDKIAASGLANLTPLALDLTSGPAPEIRFDLIASLMTLHHIADTDDILRRFHGLLNPGGLLAISDLDPEDGSFHGPEVEVHRGFERPDLAARLQRAGFERIRFSTPYVINRATGTGLTPFPLFLVLAQRA